MTSLAALLPVVLFALPYQTVDASTLIRDRIEGFDAAAGLRIGNEWVHASSVLKAVYGRRGFEPVWFEGRNLRSIGDLLLDAVRSAADEGLDPLDYHYDRIVNLKLAAEARRLSPSLDLIAELDLLLTDAFLLYADHLFHGAVDPVTIDPHWFVERREADLVPVFERAICTGRCGSTARAQPISGRTSTAETLSFKRRSTRGRRPQGESVSRAPGITAGAHASLARPPSFLSVGCGARSGPIKRTKKSRPLRRHTATLLRFSCDGAGCGSTAGTREAAEAFSSVMVVAPTG